MHATGPRPEQTFSGANQRRYQVGSSLFTCIIVVMVVVVVVVVVVVAVVIIDRSYGRCGVSIADVDFSSHRMVM